jgi:hypothetical protein
MKTTKFLTGIMAIGFAVTFLSCSKGDTGATGPAGPTGAAGAAGATGATGATGNANVKDSTFTITTAQWSSIAEYDYVAITDPQITAAIVSSGEVSVFWSTNGGVSWDNLNWVSENPTGYMMDFNYNLNTVTMYFTNNGVAANPDAVYGFTSTEFKVVSTTADGMVRYSNTYWKDYNQVQAILNAQSKSNK